MASRLEESTLAGLGVAFGEEPEDVLCSLFDRKARDFVENVCARAIPLDEPGVDVDSLGKGMVTFTVVRVDGLPRWQDEHRGVKRVSGKHGTGQHCGRAASDTLSRSLGDPVQSGVEAILGGSAHPNTPSRRAQSCHPDIRCTGKGATATLDANRLDRLISDVPCSTCT